MQDNDVEECGPDEVHNHHQYIVLLKHVLPGVRLQRLGSKVATGSCKSAKNVSNWVEVLEGSGWLCGGVYEPGFTHGCKIGVHDCR